MVDLAGGVKAGFRYPSKRAVESDRRLVAVIAVLVEGKSPWVGVACPG